MKEIMKYAQKPFRRAEVDPNNHDGWVVDLSSGDIVNPDCYWYFPTRRQAWAFIHALNGGLTPIYAHHIALDDD